MTCDVFVDRRGAERLHLAHFLSFRHREGKTRNARRKIFTQIGLFSFPHPKASYQKSNFCYVDPNLSFSPRGSSTARLQSPTALAVPAGRPSHISMISLLSSRFSQSADRRQCKALREKNFFCVFIDIGAWRLLPCWC